MPQGNPAGYGNNAHMMFRALPRDKQYALLANYTGTRNQSTLAYVADQVRNDPVSAAEVLAMSDEPLDNTIGGTRGGTQNNVQGQNVSQGGVSYDQQQGAAPTGRTNPYADGNGLVISDSGFGSGSESEQEVQGATTAQSQSANTPNDEENFGPRQDQYEGQRERDVPLVDAMTIAGLVAAGQYGAYRFQNRRNATEQAISDNIDVQDRVSARSFPQATPPAAGGYVPESPIQVGRYAIAPDMRVVDVQSGQFVDPDTARTMLMDLVAHMRDGDLTRLARWGAQNQSLATILAPEDALRLRRMFAAEPSVGDVAAAASRGRNRAVNRQNPQSQQLADPMPPVEGKVSAKKAKPPKTKTNVNRVISRSINRAM